MKAHWQKLAARYDGLLLRERWLVAAALLGGIALIGYNGFVEPALRRAQLAERNVLEQRAQISSLQSQLVVLQSPEQNPDVAAAAELARLKQRLGEVAGRLALLESSLVPPQQMSGVLEEMIGRQTGLRLLSLKTLAVAPLLEPKKAEAAMPNVPNVPNAARPGDQPANVAAGLFKHGVEIRLEGSYQELAAYLERLEHGKMKLLWSTASLSAEKHPRLVLTLTIYTLSLDRAWLIV